MKREYRIYKPNKNGNGAATKLQCSIKQKKGFDEPMLFLEIAQQMGEDDNGNAKFDWRTPEKKETQSVLMKLGLTDIGELLAVLDGKKDFAGPFAKDFKQSKGLFHQNKNGNAVLKFGKGKFGYQIAASSKIGSTVCRVWHAITDGEACVMKQVLSDFVTLYHEWL